MEISIDIVALSSIPDDTVLNLKESFIRVNDSTLAIAAKMDKTPIKKTLPISIVGNMGVIPEVRQSLYFSTIEDNKITAVLDFKNIQYYHSSYLLISARGLDGALGGYQRAASVSYHTSCLSTQSQE
jgi:hypothetical protein